MRIAVWGHDLSDGYLRTATQLGADAIDIGQGDFFAGVREQGYPDPERLRAEVRRVRRRGLSFNRVTLPDITEQFMLGGDGGERELENSCAALRVFAEAGIPIMRQRFAGDTFNHKLLRYESLHRGGYRSRGRAGSWPAAVSPRPRTPSWSSGGTACARSTSAWCRSPRSAACGWRSIRPTRRCLTRRWARSASTASSTPSRAAASATCTAAAREPRPAGRRWCWTRSTTTGARGASLPCTCATCAAAWRRRGGFEEVLLDDGDMNMFRVVRELRRVGFDGCLNPDHLQQIEGDNASAHQALAYSIGYIKALLAALAA